jgi:methylated-DNA-[protein]-cysteine S-methyltransferase
MTSIVQQAPVRHTVLSSPLGDLTVVRSTDGLTGLYFPHHWYKPHQATFGPATDAGFEDVAVQLTEYFAGRRREFDLPLRLHGSPFQHQVWDQIQQVPYGSTTTYGQLAACLGDGVNAQQVGAAVGRNPLSIVVACHRIVGSKGKLTGYAGGLERKQALLELEGAVPPAHDGAAPGLW